MTDQVKGMPYPWYEPASGDNLEQGDFIDRCIIIIPQYSLAVLSGETTEEVEYEALEHNVVVINQTCDLQTKAPVPFVVVCPRWAYNQYIDKYPNFATKENFEQVRKGKNHRFFMLNKCDLAGLTSPIQIVDLSKIFFIPYDALKQLAQVRGERIRLCSPYKEKLAQAFAYYYMRVASPIDIADFDTLHPDQTRKKQGH